MLNANRALIILFFGLLFVGSVAFASSQPPTPGPSKASNAPQDQARNEHQITQVDKRGTEDSPLIIKVADTPESKLNADQTVKYQDTETVQNWYLIVITGILAVVAAVQARILIRQTNELRKSVKVAKDAADAAKKSADALQSTERAWLFPSPKIKVNIRTDGPWGGGAEMSFCVIFTNHGKTPAILDKWRGTPIVMKEDESPTSVKEGKIIPDNSIVGEGGEYSFPFARFFKKEEWEGIKHFEIKFFYAGKITYRDVFDQIHETGFCFDYGSDTGCLHKTADSPLNYHK